MLNQIIYRFFVLIKELVIIFTNIYNFFFVNYKKISRKVNLPVNVYKLNVFGI